MWAIFFFLISFGSISIQDVYYFCYCFQIFPWVRRRWNNSQINQMLAICLSCGFDILNSPLIGKQCSVIELSQTFSCLHLFAFAAKMITFMANCLCQMLNTCIFTSTLPTLTANVPACYKFLVTIFILIDFFRYFSSHLVVYCLFRITFWITWGKFFS